MSTPSRRLQPHGCQDCYKYDLGSNECIKIKDILNKCKLHKMLEHCICTLQVIVISGMKVGFTGWK